MGGLFSHTNHTINSQIHPDCQGFEDSAAGDSRWELVTIALTQAFPRFFHKLPISNYGHTSFFQLLLTSISDWNRSKTPNAET
jgi:hypothetical protein